MCGWNKFDFKLKYIDDGSGALKMVERSEGKGWSSHLTYDEIFWKIDNSTL